MKFQLVILCVLASFVGPGVTYWIDTDKLQTKRELKFCTAPPCNITAPTLDLLEYHIFPKERFEKALRKYPSRKALNRFWNLEEKRLENVLGDGITVESFPSCVYKRLCLSEMRIGHHLAVLNINLTCWNVQPVLVTTCEYSCLPDDFKCVVDDLTSYYGYECIPEYIREVLWVYCDTADNPIRLMPVYVPFKCSAYRYCCGWETSVVYPRCMY